MVARALRSNLLMALGFAVAGSLGVLGAGGVARADSIAVWNFNDGDLLVDHGAATNALTPSAPSSVSSGSSGTATNEVSGDTAGKDLIFTAGAGLANNGQSLLFSMDLTGYTGVTLTYATERSSTGFTTQTWEYSTDNWATFTTTSAITPPTSSYGSTAASVDLSGLTGTLGTVQFKVTLTGATGSGGTNHFDNVLFAGTPVAAPLPSAAGMGIAALAGAALLAAGRRSLARGLT
ncbi:MAG: hypothetical protein ACTHN5_00725 [Phycisphaerae bacterium]